MKMKKSKGLGSLIYSEWIIPVIDYHTVLKKNERIFEIIVPILTALVCSLSYFYVEKIFVALNGLADLLPTAISVLIGFTVMLITLLLTSNGKSVELLKETMIETELHGRKISLFQGLHIQFTHSLFSEVILLIVVFVYLFWKGLGIPNIVAIILLTVEIYLTINILLSILRGITNLYFSFYKGK